MMRDHNKSTTCRAYNYYESTKALFMYRTKVRKYEGIMKVRKYFRTFVRKYFRTFIVALHVGPHVKVYTKVRRYNTGTTL